MFNLFKFLFVFAALFQAIKPATSFSADCSNSVFPIVIKGESFSSSASAVLVDSERWLLITPTQVVQDASKIFIEGGVQFEVISKDEKEGIAVLAPSEIEIAKLWCRFRSSQVQAVELSKNNPEDGAVTVCGYALGEFKIDQTFIVESSKVIPSPLDKYGFIRLGIGIPPGESGAAVLDKDGRLVGLAVTFLKKDKS